MYIVRINEQKYEYDIHALVKAFYPEEEVRVLSPESVVKDKKVWEIAPRLEISLEKNSVRMKGEGGECSVLVEGKDDF